MITVTRRVSLSSACVLTTRAVNVGVVKTVKLQLSQRSGGQRPTDLQIVTQWLRNLHLLLLWSILWRWVPWSQGWWRRCWLFPAGILRTCRQEHRGVQEPGLDQNPVCSLGRCLLKWGCQTPAPPTLAPPLNDGSEPWFNRLRQTVNPH